MNSSNPDFAAQEALNAASGERYVIPVLSERLQVDKVLEHTGTVRLRKVTHEVVEAVDAPGYRETVETTRVPVNEVVQAVKAPWQQGESLVIPVYEERLVRQLVLLEELHVVRRREAIVDNATASLRREEVIVERLDPATGQWFPEVH